MSWDEPLRTLATCSLIWRSSRTASGRRRRAPRKLRPQSLGVRHSGSWPHLPPLRDAKFEAARQQIEAKASASRKRRLSLIRINRKHAFTGLPAAWLLDGFAQFRLVIVFDRATDADGVTCATPVEVYLDLLALPEPAGEAANHLREHVLQRRMPDTPLTRSGRRAPERRVDHHRSPRRWTGSSLHAEDPYGEEDPQEAGAGELVDGPPTHLAWNRTDDQFWFHYTDRTAARAIVATLTYKVGTTNLKAPGVYVTDIMPGARTSTQLLNALFDGTRDVERTQAAVVLADSPLGFEQVDAEAWCHTAPAGSVLRMPLQIVGWAAKEDGRWLHSPSLYLS